MISFAAILSHNMRLDVYMVTQGLCSTRMKAQDAIQEGRVRVNGNVIRKNSFLIHTNMHVEVQDAQFAFASRGGHKLYNALEVFQVDLTNRICIDVGASSGGFSDVCLKKGAQLVYALDVGKDQLMPYLKEDARVVNMEGCNCRYITSSMFDQCPDFACIDVSFISVKLLLPVLTRVFHELELVVLIKPQFEAGKDKVGKHGIVKSAKVHIQVLQDMMTFVESLGYYVHHITASSMLGRDGNKEFVMHIKHTPIQRVFPLRDIVKEYNGKR